MTEQTPAAAQNDASVIAASDAAGSILPAAENAGSPAPAGVSSTGEIIASADAVLVNVSQPETPFDAGENLTGHANLSVNSTQVAGYDASLNANGVISENGVSSTDGTGSAALHQPSDAPGISLYFFKLY